ncbi:tol-pal system protein YbgF [Pelistega suis]|uniref:Cell division coordinator CpoB n=1 Tax=Pelistega suis TaxID=1631957 RepID=A0A849P6G2_9BURK|nr:tol-pal system protein YbgF [Pelistega suis]NOL51914.1 tol-pal system protein YbgF [Pelistega suis]
MTLHKKSIALLLSGAFLSLAQPAFAQEDEQARRAILELRSQLKQSDMVRNDLASQVQQLQNELRQLRGQLESLGNVGQTQVLEARANDDIGPSAQVGDPAEQRAYDAALDLFRAGDYAASSKALANFTASYPASPLAPSALFYEGSSRYANRDFQGSIKTLNEMLASYPKDPKAGDALLVIAGSQLELNNVAGSKATLERTIKEYPGTPAADTAKERLALY